MGLPIEGEMPKGQRGSAYLIKSGTAISFYVFLMVLHNSTSTDSIVMK
jgi:hypothetical protein